MTDVQIYNIVQTFHEWCLKKAANEGPLDTLAYRRAVNEGLHELHVAALAEQKAAKAKPAETEEEPPLGGS